jgi:Transposase
MEFLKDGPLDFLVPRRGSSLRVHRPPERFYRELKQRGVKVRIGMEATGHARRFERLVTELGFELWIGDPAQIKAKRVRKQKTDRQDAQLLLTLLLEDRFPRIWVPSPENRDLRQLLWHRHRLVQMRTRVMNQLQAAGCVAPSNADNGIRALFVLNRIFSSAELGQRLSVTSKSRTANRTPQVKRQIALALWLINTSLTVT